jgi:hypothetical protein
VTRHNWWRVFRRIASICGFVAALATFVENRQLLVDFVLQLMSRPGLFWQRAGAVYPIVLVTAGLMSITCWWGWRTRGRWRIPARIAVLAAGTLLPSAVTAIGLVWMLAPSPEHDHDAARLFPQTVQRGGGWIRVYGSNGQATYNVVDRQRRGPNAVANITFHAFGEDSEHSSGWVIFFLRGVSFQEFSVLKFDIRGHAGGERIGVKAKDAMGSETAIVLDERYMPGGITKAWREVRIPFKNFGRVRFDMLENVSLYSTGQMARRIPQTIAVRDFKMETE